MLAGKPLCRIIWCHKMNVMIYYVNFLIKVNEDKKSNSNKQEITATEAKYSKGRIWGIHSKWYNTCC